MSSARRLHGLLSLPPSPFPPTVAPYTPTARITPFPLRPPIPIAEPAAPFPVAGHVPHPTAQAAACLFAAFSNAVPDPAAPATLQQPPSGTTEVTGTAAAGTAEAVEQRGQWCVASVRGVGEPPVAGRDQLRLLTHLRARGDRRHRLGPHITRTKYTYRHVSTTRMEWCPWGPSAPTSARVTCGHAIHQSLVHTQALSAALI